MLKSLQYKLFGTLLTSFCFVSNALAEEAGGSGGSGGSGGKKQQNTDMFAFGDADQDMLGGTGVGAAVGSIIKLVFFIFYVLAGCFLGACGFKLANGDMGGFFKMAGGCAFLFISPLILQGAIKLGSATPQ